MVELEEKTADSATEKHVPVITSVDGGYDVVVGSTLHPMTEEHYIQWIELQLDNLVLRQYLNPGDEPKAHFDFTGSADQIWAREHCNIHGQWKGGL
jgi:superoxide reductase